MSNLLQLSLFFFWYTVGQFFYHSYLFAFSSYQSIAKPAHAFQTGRHLATVLLACQCLDHGWCVMAPTIVVPRHPGFFLVVEWTCRAPTDCPEEFQYVKHLLHPCRRHFGLKLIKHAIARRFLVTAIFFEASWVASESLLPSPLITWSSRIANRCLACMLRVKWQFRRSGKYTRDTF